MSYSPETRATLEMTSATLTRDLLSALITEIRLLPKPWAALSESKQEDVIERLTDRVTENVRMAVHLIAANGRAVVAGDLDQITIKGGTKAVIKIGKDAGALQDLYASQGKAVLLVVADPGDHMHGTDEVMPEPDQRAMDLGGEYTDQDGDGMPDTPPEPDPNVIDVPVLPAPEDGETEPFDDLYDDAARLVIAEQKCGVSFIQRRLRIGHNRAARLLELLERAGIVSTPDAMGARTVLAKPEGA